MAERGLQDWIGVQAIGKSEDEREHGRVPEPIKSEGMHFRHGLIGRPVIEGDAVGGDKNSGAILAKFAVNKNLFQGSLSEHEKKFGELSGGGNGEAANRNGDKVNSERFRLEAFLLAGVT